MISYFLGLGEFPAIATLILMACATVFIARWAVRRIGVPALGALLLMVTLIDLIILCVQIVIISELVGDAREWHSLGVLAADYLTGRSDEAVTYVAGKEGYIWILGAIYAVSGPAPIVAIAFGIVCHLWTVLAVAGTSRLLASQARVNQQITAKMCFSGGALSGLLPCFSWWAPQVLRESLTIALVSSAMAATLLFMVRKKLRNLVLMGVFVALLVWVRGSLGAVVLAGIVIAMIYVMAGRSRYHLILRGAMLSVVILAIVSFQGQLVSVLNSFGETAISTTAELSAIASSGFPGLGRGADLAQVLSQTAPRVIAGPFPWEFSATPVMLLAFMELSCWLLVVVYAIRGARRFRARGPLAAASWMLPLIVIPLIAIEIGLILTIGNYGILARFRPIATIVLVPLASAGMWRPTATRSSTRAERRTVRSLT